ncbi:choline dehydrogenase [Ectothiorhodospiraceae bacterium WFHF3C12]|nr:choline dehydrogenase [Ectothiorhodospiraceae bacterium WFHF3C12]
MYDYIIVGGGSAGCVLANRLSADPDVSVCLLEAGKPDRSLFIHVPAGTAAILPTKHCNWAFQTEPQPGLNNRRGYQPRGKTLGGSSSINAMIYMRGHRIDYDHWAALGNRGWSYEEVLPYFKRSENQERGADAWHGVGGPLNVADLRSPNPIDEVFVEAGEAAGHGHNRDFNAAEQAGVGLYQVTQKDGERCSAAKAFLTPVLDRPNLTVITQAHVTRVLFEGERAVGVAYSRRGAEHQVRASSEVILSAGALQSPQILLLSGVGPEAELKRHGISPVRVLPGVGENLHDHIDYVACFKSKAPAARELFGFSARGGMRMLRAVGEYRRDHTGMLTTNFAEAGGFLKAHADSEAPEFQLHFVVGIVDDHSRKLHLGHGYSCHVCLLRPRSRGSVRLRDADWKSPPRIDPNFLGDERDMQDMVRGYGLMREILDAAPLRKYAGRDIYTANARTDADIAEAIRQRADTVYHPVGTCKMGQDDMAVVDEELRVHGLEGLRVVDASVMPTVMGGNTNAPAIMIGEKAADMILGRSAVPQGQARAEAV